MALADILDTYKTKEEGKDIVSKVKRHLLKEVSGNDFMAVYSPPRSTDVFHPSSVARSNCLRKLQFKALNAERTDRNINARGQRIFDTGHDFGYRFQAYLWDMGVLLGKWHCVECKHEWLDMDNPSPEFCPNCDAEFAIWYNLHYLEVPVEIPEYNVQGSADGVVINGEEKEVIELKTIKNRTNNTRDTTSCFEDLQSPKEAHINQISLYIKGIKENYDGYEDVDKGSIIYTGKNNQKLKHYSVTLEDSIVNKLLDRISMVEYAIEGGYLLERAGHQKSSGVCRWCDFKKLCWDKLDENSNIDEIEIKEE